MGFWQAVGDWALAVGNPPEYERRLAARRAAAASTQPRRGGAGRVARGTAAAGFVAGVAFTGAQAYDEPAQNDLNTRGNYAGSSAENRRTSQARGQRRETTYKGRQRGGSSQQD